MERLKLVSHHLCPYVQRAAIALAEKGIPFDREWIDLTDKPEWFKSTSPLGKVPLLMVFDDKWKEPTVLFESAVIVEFLEEAQPNPLHPSDPVERARHRAWIEFASNVLNGVARLYNAASNDAIDAEVDKLQGMFARLENDLEARSGSFELNYFAGQRFSLVDAAFGPVFRYFDTFEETADLYLLNNSHKYVSLWRRALAERQSVKSAIDNGYPDRLRQFLVKKGTAISMKIE